MVSAISQLAGAPFANLLVLAGLVCIAVSIFGWARETIAASSGFRTVSGLAGVLLLFCVYGIYLPHATRSNQDARSGDAEHGRPVETRSAPTQQASATGRTQSLAQQSPQSAQPALGADGTNASPQQQQSPQPSASQAPPQNLFSGRWKNADPKTAGILFLKVEERGEEITVRAWGICLPQHANGGRAGDPVSQYCDWGTGRGVVRDGEANVIWRQGQVLRRMKLEPDGASLRVVLDSTSRGRSQHTEAHFAKSL